MCNQVRLKTWECILHVVDSRMLSVNFYTDDILCVWVCQSVVELENSVKLARSQ